MFRDSIVRVFAAASCSSQGAQAAKPPWTKRVTASRCKERIADHQRFEAPSVLQVFAPEYLAIGTDGRLNDQRIPNRNRLLDGQAHGLDDIGGRGRIDRPR